MALLGSTKKIFCLSTNSIVNKFTVADAFLLQSAAVSIPTRFKSFVFKDEEPPRPDYQHIEKSSLPTFHFQKSLPRLPIPALQDTCTRYLRAQQPLLTPQQFAYTSSCVQKFLDVDGPQCHATLVKEDKQNKTTSYITKPWFDMYLSDRNPLPINFNPFLVFVDNPKPSYNTQLVKAANLVISSLRFYRSLTDEILQPEVYHMNPAKSDTPKFRQITRMLPMSVSWYGAYFIKAYPLDMSQYTNLFNTSRVPEITMDRIKHVEGARHLLVMRRGHFYVMDVIDMDGNIITPARILSQLEDVLERDDPPPEHPLGVLTTAGRDNWAIARSHLNAIGNKDALNLIDSALFNLVLDDEKPGEDPVKKIRLFLHSDGVNRWFDKSFSLIVSGDGTAGINFEHSWGDGVAVLRYFNDIHKDSTKKPQVNHDTFRKDMPPVRKLEFKLDDQMKEWIDEARRKYDATCRALEVRVVDYKLFGRNLCKPLNISPDAVMQLAFQMAHNELAGKPVSTYESCSTAAFKHGRTETVRPCTLETQRFCRALKKEPDNWRELQQLIIQCSKVHSNLIKEAAMGKGFDRHLFALRLKASTLGLSPTIFNDPAYAGINHNILSTSTLSSDNLQLGAFGPVVRDGFGIGYSIWADRLGTIVTNYENHADGAGFIKALTYCLDQIYNILNHK